MTISARLGLFFLLAGLLLTALVFSVTLAFKATQALNHAQAQRFISYQLADELRRSSDDLTRMVRSYVVTGNRAYYHHFNQIQEIRDGTTRLPSQYNHIFWNLVSQDHPPDRKGIPATPLILKMQRAGFSESELLLLAQAKRESDALIRIEDQAMLLMDKYNTLRTQSPHKVDTSLHEKATNLVFNNAYHEAKARIMKPIPLFYETVDRRTLAVVESAQAKQQFYFFWAAGILALAVLFSLFAFYHLKQQLIAPLAALLQWVIGIETARFNLPRHSQRKDEFGQLENAFIRMATKINSKIVALQELAGKDTLTGAASLRRGRDYFQLCARAAERNGSRIALAFLDLNDFKPINNTHGHAAGDKVLISVVSRLKGALRANDMVCRIGGDEFLIIMPDNTINTPTRKIIEKLQRIVAQPLSYKSVQISVSASAGIAIYPDQGRDFDQLIACADKAMYEQKSENKKAPCGALNIAIAQQPT